MYTEITEQSAILDEIERQFGTSHAEQAAHLYEDNDDDEQYNVNALREIESFCEDFDDDRDAEYIRNRAHTVIARLTDEAREAAVQEIEKGHTIKMEMRLDAQIALAIGSGRTELLPTEERIRQNLTPDDETTPNEAALMANLAGWIEMAVEASRHLIEAKTKVAKLEEEAEEAQERFAVVQQELKAITKHARRADHTITGQRQWPEDVGRACS